MGRTATRYARTDDGLYLAYETTGSGGVGMVEVSDGTLLPIDATSEQPRWEGYVERLGGFGRLVRYDARGIGMSDPIGGGEPPTVEQSASDVLAVLDAADVGEVAVIASSFGGLAGIYLAAKHPERVAALVLVNAYARLLRDDDYPHGVPGDRYFAAMDAVVEPGGSVARDLELMAPSLAGDEAFAEWWRRAGNRGASPATARAMWKASAADVRALLPSVQAPTLVVATRGNGWVRAAHSRHLADHIPDARLLELPGGDHVTWLMGPDLTDEIEEFLTGERSAVHSDRRLATVMFSDIVRSTEHAVALGDGEWRRLLERHDLTVRRQLDRFDGRLVKTIGDGALATFDGPARAIRCAVAIRDAVRQLGVEVRVGVHTGEVEQRGDDIAGVAVHLAQRVQATADPGEVMVSRTVVDLVAGSGATFDDRGEHELKGIPGSWRLFAVTG